MNPAEWLRSVSRRTADDDLAVEAGEALAGFARQPAHLVVACRRLLAHHPEQGPLWWLCARVLAAPDPAQAARDSIRLLDADRTAERLGATLPLADPDHAVAVLGWSRAVDRALADRADLDVIAVRTEGVDPAPALRHRVTDRSVRVTDAWGLGTRPIDVLLVPALAFDAARALTPAGTAALLAATGPATAVWLVGGVGRVLPGRLLDAALGALEREDPVPECGPLEHFDRVVGPRGRAGPGPRRRASRLPRRARAPATAGLSRPGQRAVPLRGR